MATGPDSRTLAEGRDIDQGRTEQWLLDATAELDPSDAEVSGLGARVLRRASGLARPRVPIATDRDRIEVTDLVVRRLLMASLTDTVACDISSIALDVHERVVYSMNVEISVRYSDDIAELADRLRRCARVALVDLLGERAAASIAERINVRVVDILVDTSVE